MKKKFYQKKWFIVLMVVLVLGMIGGAMGGNKETTDTPSSADTQQAQPESIEEQKTEETVSSKETPQPRENSIGTSNQDIDSIEANFTVSAIKNDTTGNWRISAIAENVNMQEYALSYYQKYFTDDKEIHGIVNFNSNTTTKISVMGDMLDVTVYEYVDGEEHDADKLFGGMLLKQYFVYLDNGDIEEVQ